MTIGADLVAKSSFLRSKNQQQENGEQHQMNTTLKDIRLPAPERNNARAQSQDEQWKISTFKSERD